MKLQYTTVHKQHSNIQAHSQPQFFGEGNLGKIN